MMLSGWSLPNPDHEWIFLGSPRLHFRSKNLLPRWTCQLFGQRVFQVHSDFKPKKPQLAIYGIFFFIIVLSRDLKEKNKKIAFCSKRTGDLGKLHHNNCPDLAVRQTSNGWHTCLLCRRLGFSSRHQQKQKVEYSGGFFSCLLAMISTGHHYWSARNSKKNALTLIILITVISCFSM